MFLVSHIRTLCLPQVTKSFLLCSLLPVPYFYILHLGQWPILINLCIRYTLKFSFVLTEMSNSLSTMSTRKEKPQLLLCVAFITRSKINWHPVPIRMATIKTNITSALRKPESLHTTRIREVVKWCNCHGKQECSSKNKTANYIAIPYTMCASFRFVSFTHLL